MRELVDDELLQEACGVVGVLDPVGELPVAQITYTALTGLQHRGEGAAGILSGVWRNEQFCFEGMKDVGTVAQVFQDGGVTLDAMNPDATIAVGHVRWATSGSEGVDPFFEAQPFGSDGVLVAENGHIETMVDVARQYGIEGCATDGDALTRTLGFLARQGHQNDVLNAMHDLLPRLDGGYSLVVAEAGQLYGVRDPWGTRPLWLGRLANGAVMFASEQPVLHEAGKVIEEQELQPGQIIAVNAAGEIDESFIRRQGRDGMCALEGIYFARPDGKLNGKSVYQIRMEMGRALAQEQPVEADIVIGVPDSGTVAALGFAEASGIPFGVGLFRNPYVTRTFIQSTQEARRRMVLQKLRPNREVLEGKRVVVIDDSIVRGTSTETLTEILRGAGASEVHYRISSAPFVNPCFSGTAISKPESLFARRYTTPEEQCHQLGANSLGFLSTEAIAKAMGRQVGGLCMACMDGQYMFDVPTPASARRQLLPLATVHG
jgi:amidophosphoribosyltransferase